MEPKYNIKLRKKYQKDFIEYTNVPKSEIISNKNGYKIQGEMYYHTDIMFYHQTIIQ